MKGSGLNDQRTGGGPLEEFIEGVSRGLIEVKGTGGCVNWRYRDGGREARKGGTGRCTAIHAQKC